MFISLIKILSIFKCCGYYKVINMYPKRENLTVSSVELLLSETNNAVVVLQS